MENFATASGQHTNAVYGFTSMLVNVLRDEQPTHVAVAFDKSRQTFRLEQYSDYKAKRNKTPDEFGSQLPLIRGCSTRSTSSTCRWTASRPTTSSPPSPPRGWPRACRS